MTGNKNAKVAATRRALEAYAADRTLPKPETVRPAASNATLKRAKKATKPAKKTAKPAKKTAKHEVLTTPEPKLETPNADQVLSTNELLTMILSDPVLTPHDLFNARDADPKWRALIDGTPKLQRLLCVEPITYEQCVSMTWGRVAHHYGLSNAYTLTRYVCRVDLRSSPQECWMWNHVPHYDIASNIQIPRSLRPQLITIPWEGKGRKRMEAHREDFISKPRMTTLTVHLLLEGPLRSGGPTISYAMLQVTTAIKVGHVLDAYDGMLKSEIEYGDRRGRGKSYECQIWGPHFVEELVSDDIGTKG